MRWTKIIGLLVAGAVIGGVVAGYAVFEYMERWGIDWNKWASSQYDEQKAGDALGTVAALSDIRAGKIEDARRVLEWRLTSEIPELVGAEKAGLDPRGDTSRALSAIREYRRANPWTSGNQKLDKLTSDALNGVAGPADKVR
ncbi:hypothetical protein [Dyella mobilis]|uniref:Uncharacterized protein n=1 Tax=Dyella mobilis TaxID=1849582 RepID=A0ABS2KCK7_9GAMM|nr:hypothetical protein [Dyella mobilis]MBM7128834.1 hypothetical protein [Dyella mobilis]GLQ99165.1 hypothetical protein GCM10007863_35850 [Dyella mobilis]